MPSNYQTVTNLLSSGGWYTAGEIYQICGIGARELRAMAEETEALIGGSGGYKRADLATAEELEHAGRSLLSRGRKNAHRGLAHLRQARALREASGPLFANVRE